MKKITDEMLQEVLDRNHILVSIPAIKAMYRFGRFARTYHNFNHVRKMIDELVDSSYMSDAMITAILFHDVIYEGRSDDEEQSAECFLDFCSDNTDPSFKDHVVKLILATRYKARMELVKEGKDFDTANERFISNLDFGPLLKKDNLKELLENDILIIEEMLPRVKNKRAALRGRIKFLEEFDILTGDSNMIHDNLIPAIVLVHSTLQRYSESLIRNGCPMKIVDFIMLDLNSGFPNMHRTIKLNCALELDKPINLWKHKSIVFNDIDGTFDDLPLSAYLYNTYLKEAI